MGHVTLLAGPGGVGKSLLAQQIGSALALGTQFVDAVPEPRRVLMWSSEDDEHEIWRRQVAIARSLSVGLDAFAGKLIIESFAGRDCTLAATTYGHFGVTAMLEELRQQVHDYKADVVILDNVGRTFGGNENDRHQVTAFIAELVGATARRAAAVLLLGHPGRNTGSEFSGSSAWENAVRARLWLSDRPPDHEPSDNVEPASDMRYLARRKANYSARDLRSFRYDGGIFVPIQFDGCDLLDSIRRVKADRVILDALHKLGDMGQMPNDGTTSPNFLPKLTLDYKLNEGLTKRELADAMRRQMKDGKLRRAEIGSYPNRAPRYGLRQV
jgi:RecA-family ATPase